MQKNTKETVFTLIEDAVAHGSRPAFVIITGDKKTGKMKLRVRGTDGEEGVVVLDGDQTLDMLAALDTFYLEDEAEAEAAEATPAPTTLNEAIDKAVALADEMGLGIMVRVGETIDLGDLDQLAKEFGEHLGKPFEALPPHLQKRIRELAARVGL